MNEIIERLRSYNPDIDEDRYQKAITFIEKSGSDSFKDHSLALSIIESLIPLRPDDSTLMAALMHRMYSSGLVDDSLIEDVVGPKTMSILRGVKKLESLVYVRNDRSAQLENLRKMILVIAKDIRVILVALACRLYNMRNQDDVGDDKEILAYSSETLNLYVPICSRLGIYHFKSQLEDLAFRYSDPEEYEKIAEQLESLRNSCNLSIAFIQESLKKFLLDNGVRAEVSGRIKNLYSIHKKLHRKGLDRVGDLYDIFAMRIILPSESSTDQLYGVLGLIHSEWKPLSKRFKDYLAVPKPNGYRSLHTVVLGLAPKDMDQPVEIQIRNKDMHREAEYGIASHWVFKESADLNAQKELIRGLEDIRSDFDLDQDVIKEIEIDLFKDRIFVLTPRGEVKELILGSNPVDFAYAVHTDVGNKCVMAKVNGSVVSLDYELQNNDVVEILTRKNATPRLRWLSMVKTHQAKNKIKAWFSSQNRESNIKEGRKLLNAQFERIGKPSLDQKYSVLKSYSKKGLTLSERESLVEEVGNGAKLPRDIAKKVYPYRENVASTFAGDKIARKGKKFKEESESFLLKDQILVGGEDGLPLKIGACCNPTMKNQIIGYVTRGTSITIHRSDCEVIDSLIPERIIFADWKGRAQGGKKYHVGIKITALSRVGMMRDITSAISSFDILIRDVNIKRSRNGVSEEFFMLEFNDLDVFDQLLDKLEHIRGVVKVVRDK